MDSGVFYAHMKLQGKVLSLHTIYIKFSPAYWWTRQRSLCPVANILKIMFILSEL